MNRLKFLFAIYLYFLCLNASLFSQESEGVNYDSILVKSYIDNKPEKLSFHYSVIRYQNSVDIVLLPVLSGLNSDIYEIQIYDQLSSTPIRIINLGDAETTRVSNLQKDKEYTVKVFKRDYVGNQQLVEVDTEIISTEISEEFRASRGLYKAIGDWSFYPNQNQKLIDFLRTNVNQFNSYEIAAFMQYHYKLNDISDTYINNIASFVQNTNVSGGTSTNNGTQTKKCNCSLILNTYRDAPSISESYSGSPEETNYLAIGNGAAKNMKLSMVGKHASGKYEANIGGVVSPLYSIISYNLVCSDYYTDLPEECMCPKKILYDYSYTARLTTKAKKGGGTWIWSAGAEATAEDYALLTIRNGGSVSAADAGRIRISSNCNSSWNSGWWSQAANVIVSAAGVAIDSNATLSSWANLLPSVVTLFSTNFFNKSGDCTDKNEINNLMAGSGELTLTTNKPVDILISSLGYEYVRGFGKWDSRSAIVSDYHLAVVLLGQDLNRPECCTPNVADFHIGNFEDVFVTLQPFNIQIKVLDGSVNSDANLKGKVNRLFTLWGPWPGLVRDGNGHYILNGDDGHFVRTFPGCAPIDPINEGDLENRTAINHNNIKVFPNPVNDEIHIKQQQLTNIVLYDMQGKVMINQYVDKNNDIHSLNVSHLPSGQYFLIATDNEGKIWYNRFQKI